MSHIPVVRGEVIVFAGHDVARISPATWPSLRADFEAALERVQEEPDAEKAMFLDEKWGKWFEEKLGEIAIDSAGLLTMDEVQAIVRLAIDEGMDEGE